jgi:hypothetical protein
MEHITKILDSKGYKTYRKGCVFPNQNASAKEQYKLIMKREDLIFVEGDKTTDTASFYYPFGSILKINDFSTMIVGGTNIRFVKDEDFENQIIWGFLEHGKPPTLIHPRPKINVKRFREFNGKKYLVNENESTDDSMNLCLSKENHNDILNALNDDTILYKYDLTTTLNL